ncbi:MAG: hypothetical protein WCK29_04000 [archaeon]
MFWNKKEEKELPDLPPIKSPFSRDFNVPKSDSNSPYVKPSEPVKETNESSNDHSNADSDEEVEKHSLPSFPDSPIAKGFSQAAIKDAINQDEIKEEPVELPQKMPEKPKTPEKKFKLVEMDEPSEENFRTNPFLSSMNSQIQKSKKEVKTSSYTPSYARNDSLSIGLPPVEKEEEQNNEFSRDREPEPVVNKTPVQKGDIFVKIDKFFSAKKALDSIDDQVNEIDSLLNKIRETKLKEEKELANWEKQITLIKSRIQNINDTIFEKTQ